MFIFFGGEGAGSVAQPPTGADELGGGVQDGGLAEGASGDEFGGPVTGGFGGLTEHAFAGAGGINEDAVEIFGKGIRKTLGSLVRDESVARTPAFEVFGEVPHPLGVDFVSDQDSLVFHFRGDVGGFPAWGRGEIEDALARLGVEDFRNGLGGGFLQVVESRGVIGVKPGPVFRFQYAKTRVRPE